MAGKNDRTQEVEIELGDNLREDLGIVDLESQIDELKRQVARLQHSFGEWLVYVNLIDRRVQALGGEPIIEETIAYHARPDGDVQLTRQRPPIPSNLVSEAPKIAKNQRG